MAFYLRKMQLNDVGQVTEIDREAFSTQWPPPNYKRELQNGLSHHVVAIDDSVKGEGNPEKWGNVPGSPGILMTLARWLRLYREPDGWPDRDYIVGFAGLWAIADEAHITCIAVREKYRGMNFGVLLLAALCDLAIRLKARCITLEVRVSNKVAQNLYSKFGFKEVGLRRGYYTNNREDALLLSIVDTDSAAFRGRLEQLKRDYLRTSRQILRENIFSGNL